MPQPLLTFYDNEDTAYRSIGDRHFLPVELHYFILNTDYCPDRHVGEWHSRCLFSDMYKVEKKIEGYWTEKYVSPSICWQRIVIMGTRGVPEDSLDLRKQLEWLKKLRTFVQHNDIDGNFLRRAEDVMAREAIGWTRDFHRFEQIRRGER